MADASSEDKRFLAMDHLARCTVIGEGTKTAEVNVTSQVILTTTSSTCKIDSSVVVVGQLKSLYNGSVIKCDIDQSEPGEYRIQYTPTVRGRHELTVSVDGQQVAGSPFPVFVSIHPTQLGKPVKVWKFIPHVYGITSNTAGDVIVTEHYGSIVKLKPNGRKCTLVGHYNTKLYRLVNVITDSEDNIYCADGYYNRIMKCNKNGGDVQVYEVDWVNSQGHYGMLVLGNELMLCECNIKGTIRIFDKQFEYVRCIEGEGDNMGEFIDLCGDNRGNLYVIDDDKNCVHVFTVDGVFQRSFGNGESLNSPRCSCVSGDYLYVTNYHGHNVSVFSTAGEYITSFGQKGRGEGEFSSPCGICSDNDGFLYVADSLNGSVQCF